MVASKQVRVFDPHSLGINKYKLSGTNQIMFCCPFHGDSTPSTTLNLNTGLFFCYACGAKGNAEKLAQVLGGKVSYLDKLPLIQDFFETRDEIATWLKNKPADGSNAYLIKRGVTEKEIEEYSILATASSVIFPLFDNDEIIGVMIRQTANNIKFGKYIVIGEKPPIYPMQKWDDSKKNGVLVEGIFGAIRGRKYGYNVFATLGVNVKSSIERFIHSLKWIVCFDDDLAGYISASKLAMKYNNVQVQLPGRETDESLLKEWQWITDVETATKDPRKIALYSGLEKSEFFKRMNF